MEKSVALSNLSIYYTCKNIKKISAPTWNDRFELPDGWYSASDIQDYFEYFLKKHNKNIDNSSIRICVNKLKIELHLKLKLDILLSF